MENENATILTDVAIVVPVYNAEKYLKQCINSVLRQTFTNFCLILVDDGSTDSSGKICDGYAKRDSRVVVIHQENLGSVKARKKGVLSEAAQSAIYIMFCDADDTLDRKALEKLIDVARKYNADCVCGGMKKNWKGIPIYSKYKAKCFQISRAECYDNKKIIEKLYISCFGVTNYPVSLCAKIYDKKLITKAIDFAPIVQFMGDDLSVTLRCLPMTENLVIIPDVIYNYRIGGNTSKFMPWMFDDFISLYKNKRILAEKYTMPQDAIYYINVEIMNVVITWLKMCYKQGNCKEQKFHEEIKRVCDHPVIRKAAQELYEKNNYIAEMIRNYRIDNIEEKIYEEIRRNRKKDFVKNILQHI